MTLFDVRIPGLPMTVVAADGNAVEPVVVDEFRMGVAEAYDVIFQPRDETRLHHLCSGRRSHRFYVRNADPSPWSLSRRAAHGPAPKTNHDGHGDEHGQHEGNE